ASDEQIQTMLKICQNFSGQWYGFHKVILLMLRGNFPGIVHRLFPWPTGLHIRNPFCSEAVAAACWSAGLYVCREMGKEEPSAITAANLYTYAMMKGTALNIIYSSP